MTQTAKIDEVLRSAIERGDLPGVVAMTATRDGVAYDLDERPTTLRDRLPVWINFRPSEADLSSNISGMWATADPVKSAGVRSR